MTISTLQLKGGDTQATLGVVSSLIPLITSNVVSWQEHRSLVTALEARAAQASDHGTRLHDLLARKVSDENRRLKIKLDFPMCCWDFGGLGMLFRIGRGTFDGTLHCRDGRNDTMAAIGRLLAVSKF
jgi:hypothetical protein